MGSWIPELNGETDDEDRGSSRGTETFRVAVRREWDHATKVH
jgi:hypothetical protein